jgi:hypothetical protein
MDTPIAKLLTELMIFPFSPLPLRLDVVADLHFAPRRDYQWPVAGVVEVIQKTCNNYCIWLDSWL